MGSSTSHPVSCTITTPSTTPTEVHTSVSRGGGGGGVLGVALSVIERNLRPPVRARARDTAVDRGGHERHGETEAHVRSGCGSTAGPTRNPDPGRGDYDERALQSAGEIFALLWPKACSSSGGRTASVRAHSATIAANEVYDRLGRVGEESDRSRKIVGPKLQPDGNYSSRYREHSVATRRPAVRRAAFVTVASPWELRRAN